MDKTPWNECKNMIKQCRLLVQELEEHIREIDEYLVRLMAERENCPPASESEYVSRLENEVRAQDLRPGGFEVITDDPRRPYQNQRQPRRDGDSYGSVLPPKDAGGADGTKTTDGGE